MPYPDNYTFDSIPLSAYTPSVGTTPVAAYMAAPARGVILRFSGILGGAITTANGTVTVTNVTQGTTVGSFVVTQAGSVAGQFQAGAPNSNAVAQVNENDVLAFTPSGATGASIPMFFSALMVVQ